MSVNTPVVFLIFNRPDTTARVFQAIARAEPRTLLIVADGPRPDRPGEAEKCRAARVIAENVTWPCEVLKNYAPTNLGCRRRVSSGLTWAFNTVPEAIVLEDDCLPAPSFFPFCECLLERYRHDDRVMHIGGCNLVSANQRLPYSYYFSRYAHVWGWASWCRAWQHYQVDMSAWPQCKRSGYLRGIHAWRQEVEFWTRQFDRVVAGVIDTWDYEWLFTCWLHKGLCVIPRENLVSNIGFRSDGTHTKTRDRRFAERAVGETMKLDHPPTVEVNVLADGRSFHELYRERKKSWRSRLRSLYFWMNDRLVAWQKGSLAKTSGT
jgi:hypothetical protein